VTDLPKISVITVVFNAIETIKSTIESVLSQDYSNFEYIIIDGGSDDGTVEIINAYLPQINTFVSEPDEGIADAMNKGLFAAGGDFVYYLNADDVFAGSGVLTECVEMVNTDDEILVGSLMFGEGSYARKITSRGFSLWMNFKGISHQAALCRRDVLNALGGFDQTFKICMDYDVFLRAYREGFNCRKIDLVFSVMGADGISSRKDSLGVAARLAEEKKVHEKNCRSGWLRLAYLFWWRIYPRYRLSKCDGYNS